MVALTDALPRTTEALEDAGFELRRVAGPMAFFRFGECILELVERGTAAVSLWGVVFVVDDLDGLGPLVGEPRDAVQPGRRIATVQPRGGPDHGGGVHDPATATRAGEVSWSQGCAAPSTLALVLAAAVAAPARADYVIEGRGWGHGVGMSQYGAYGYALNEGRDFRFILGHYYTGTSVGRVAASRIRVLLRRAREPKVCGATLLRDAGGRKVRLRDTRVYKLSPWGAGGLQGRRHLQRPPPRARARPGAGDRRRERLPPRRGRERRQGRQLPRRCCACTATAARRWSSTTSRWSPTCRASSPAEMPATWPAEALKAQAVVARSYALRSRRPGERFDVYADTRSQVYRGVAGEVATVDRRRARHPRARRPLRRRDRPDVLPLDLRRAHGRPTRRASAAACRSRTCGPSTIPTTRCRPYHTWTVTLDDRDAQRKLSSVREGDLDGLEVSATTPTGRVSTVDVIGSDATVPVSGAEIRRLLELRSTWFTIRREETR